MIKDGRRSRSNKKCGMPVGMEKTDWFKLQQALAKPMPSWGQSWLKLLKMICHLVELSCCGVTPLRALSSDIASSAKRMIDGLGLTWQVGLRTGDTTSREKARQNQTLPQVLITTPESLHILIAQKGGARRLSEVHMIVVDEWHELVGTKREFKSNWPCLGFVTLQKREQVRLR